MPLRNKDFRTKEPFRHDDNVTLHHAEGPFSFLNPTRAHFHHAGLSPPQESNGNNTPLGQPPKQVDSTVPAAYVKFLWRSRDNRKGRHPLLVQPASPGEDAPFVTPRRTSDPREVVKNVVRTFTYFPVWDISWLVGFIFTWGSVVWVINVCLYFSTCTLGIWSWWLCNFE